ASGAAEAAPAKASAAAAANRRTAVRGVIGIMVSLLWEVGGSNAHAAQEALGDQHQQHEAAADQEEAQRVGSERHRARRRVDEVLAQLAAVEQAAVLHAMFACEVL